MRASCAHARTAFHRLLDGEERPDDRQIFEDHSQQCDACRDLAEGWFAVDLIAANAPNGRARNGLAQEIVEATTGLRPARRHRMLRVAAPVALAATALLVGLWAIPGDETDSGFRARGGTVGPLVGIRAFCVSGDTAAPMIREVRSDPMETVCKVGDVLQFSATVPLDSRNRCLFLVGQTSSGESLFSLPPGGIPACLALPAGPAAVVNEPLPGGIRLAPEWAGQQMILRAFFADGPLDHADPDASAAAQDRRVLKIERAGR